MNDHYQGPISGRRENSWEMGTFLYDRLHTRLQIIAQQIAHYRPRTLLELGCGVGLLRNEFLQQYGTSLVYYGCDISHAAVQCINDQRVVQFDLNRGLLPFQGITFDCVIGSGIFEYIEQLPVLLHAIWEKLEYGGMAFMSYFNMNHIYRRLYAMMRREPPRHPSWKNTYSLQEFTSFLTQANFSILRQLPVSIGLLPPPRAIAQMTPPSQILPLLANFSPTAIVHTMVFCCRKE